MLIDDNADANRSLQLLLQLMGHEVTTAGDGNSGLKAIFADRPEVVICDIGLPDINGHGVASRVRDELPGDKPIMIALTGYCQESDRALALSSGFDHFLVKPVDPHALLKLIGSISAVSR